MPHPLRHAIDVTTDVAVTVSSLRKILHIAIAVRNLKAWLTVIAGCNRQRGLSHIASASSKALARLKKVKKRAAVAGGSRVYREASNRVDRSHSVSRKLDTPLVMIAKA